MQDENQTLEEVKGEIRKVLDKYGVEIAPALKYTDMGIFPEVRIVKVPTHETSTSETVIPVQE